MFLLELPFEIRHRIWTYVFDDANLVLRRPTRSERATARGLRPLGLLCVSKAVHVEALPCFYAVNCIALRGSLLPHGDDVSLHWADASVPNARDWEAAQPQDRAGRLGLPLAHLPYLRHVLVTYQANARHDQEREPVAYQNLLASVLTWLVSYSPKISSVKIEVYSTRESLWAGAPGNFTSVLMSYRLLLKALRSYPDLVQIRIELNRGIRPHTNRLARQTPQRYNALDVASWQRESSPSVLSDSLGSPMPKIVGYAATPRRLGRETLRVAKALVSPCVHAVGWSAFMAQGSSYIDVGVCYTISLHTALEFALQESRMTAQRQRRKDLSRVCSDPTQLNPSADTVSATKQHRAESEAQDKSKPPKAKDKNTWHGWREDEHGSSSDEEGSPTSVDDEEPGGPTMGVLINAYL